MKEKEIQQIEKLDKREKEGIPISNNGTIYNTNGKFFLILPSFF